MNDLREVPSTTGRPIAAISSEAAQQLEVVLERLAEADPRVQLHALLGDPGRHGGGEPLLEERLDVGDDVVVARVLLHRARLAEHVHQAAVEAAVGDEGRPARARGGTRSRR